MSLQSKRDFHKCACMRESRCWTFFHITGSGGQQRARRPASVMWPLSSMSWWSLESPGGRGGKEEKWVLAITPHLIFITPLTHTHPPIQRMERETIEMFLFENSTPNNMPPIPPNCVCACVCVCVCVCVLPRKREQYSLKGLFLILEGMKWRVKKEREREWREG